VTGRWPLLLRLVNTILADYARVEPSAVSAQGMVLLVRWPETFTGSAEALSCLRRGG